MKVTGTHRQATHVHLLVEYGSINLVLKWTPPPHQSPEELVRTLRRWERDPFCMPLALSTWIRPSLDVPHGGTLERVCYVGNTETHDSGEFAWAHVFYDDGTSEKIDSESVALDDTAAPRERARTKGIAQ